MIKDLAIKDKIEETFKVHPAYGHRRLAIELKMNKKKTFYIVAETLRFLWLHYGDLKIAALEFIDYRTAFAKPPLANSYPETFYVSFLSKRN